MDALGLNGMNGRAGTEWIRRYEKLEIAFHTGVFCSPALFYLLEAKPGH
jgi:hypothetical protein